MHDLVLVCLLLLEIRSLAAFKFKAVELINSVPMALNVTTVFALQHAHQTVNVWIPNYAFKIFANQLVIQIQHVEMKCIA